MLIWTMPESKHPFYGGRPLGSINLHNQNLSLTLFRFLFAIQYVWKYEYIALKFAHFDGENYPINIL